MFSKQAETLSFTGRTGADDLLVRAFGIKLWLVVDNRDEFIAQFPDTEQGAKDLSAFVWTHGDVADWTRVCAWSVEDAKAHYFKAHEQYQEVSSV